ncbi:MAG: endopeptidase La [Bacteroidales bacterium]|nr:endopeptidase La [Bacteroidales bacterium]
MKNDKKGGHIGVMVANAMDSLPHVIQIPISDKGEKVDWQSIGDEIPILPLRGNVLYPMMVIPIQSARQTSVELMKKCYRDSAYFAAVTQKDNSIDSPMVADLYEVGTLARVAKILELPDGSIAALVQGVARVRITGQGSKCNPEEEYITATYKACRDYFADKNDPEFEALVQSIKQITIEIVELGGELPHEAVFTIRNIEAPGFLMSFVATHIAIDIEDKVALLAMNSQKKRAQELLALLTTEKQKNQLRGDIKDKVQRKMDKEQRDYFLNQQIKTIQRELGADPATEQIKELEARAGQKNWPDHVREAFDKEMKRLKTINTQSPDFAIEINYVQTLLDLPWNDCSDDDFTIESARQTLDNDHYGLEKVKERILEYLAVLKLRKDLKSPILCLYGPPGVGKTSLGRSIANALGRKYARISLGGLHDEAEIRGHRKTYIGAMPGRIIQNIKKVGTSNPVFVLDEIDKVDSNFHGDPAAALLEVLDPEQNTEFHDNFLELDYDLSKVLFIATANNISKISQALLDRMELIDVSGYVAEEKLQIAKRHLMPKALDNHGLETSQLEIQDDVMLYLINNYTRESGVRELSNVLASICRKAAVKIASGESAPAVTMDYVTEALGKPKYLHDEYYATRQPGVIPGLAWTSAGGELLYIESLLCNGNGTLNITGNLGKVMKESAEIAINYLCANEDALGIDHRMFKEFDLSLHFPEGAVPKDGPSAGITIFTALASLYTQRPVRPLIAMTGELTLSGRVLPVGGIKEKILGAKRAGIKRIFMSEENRRDIDEINPLYIDGLEFTYVKTAMELIPMVLEDKQVKNPVKVKDKKKE